MEEIQRKNILFLFIALGLIIIIGGLYYFFHQYWPQYQAKQFEKSRLDIINYLISQLSNLSPDEPNSNKQWQPIRFSFPLKSNEYVYVEYKTTGYIVRKILLTLSKKDDSFKAKVVAYFEPGLEGWELKEGQDLIKNQTLEVYHYEDGKWMKTGIQ